MIPKSLKTIDSNKAKAIIQKNLKNKTGYYEYGTFGDFVYNNGKNMIRESCGTFEIGKVCN